METFKVGSVSVAVAPEDKPKLEAFLEDAADALERQPALLTRVDELMRHERATEGAALALVDAALKLMMQVHEPRVAVARIAMHLAPGWRDPGEAASTLDIDEAAADEDGVEADASEAPMVAEVDVAGADTAAGVVEEAEAATTTTVSPETVAITLAAKEAA